jgi:hypothetical protein
MIGIKRAAKVAYFRMSRLQELKDQIKASGLVADHLIDQYARRMHHNEKIQALPTLIQNKIKQDLKKSAG